jgi:peptide/nickel transport system substrate-binding protein
MFRNRRRPRVARVVGAGAAALLAVGLIAACGGSNDNPGGGGGGGTTSTAPTGAAAAGGTARVALPAGVTLSYIYPFTPLANSSEYNSQAFQQLMYRQLYQFGGNDQSVTVNYPLSVANAPVF